MRTNSLKGKPAGFLSRFVAYFIDVAIITILIWAGSWVINTTLAWFGLKDGIVASAVAIYGLTSLIVLVLVTGYYVFFWTLTGQTPGKMILGVRVVTTGGQRLSFSRSLLRFFGYIVSFLVLFLGFVWILVDDERQGWHDKIARTHVLYAWDAHLEETFMVEAIDK